MKPDYSDFDNGVVRPRKDGHWWATAACLVLASAAAACVHFSALNREGAERCYGDSLVNSREAALSAIRCREYDQNLRRDCRYVTIVGYCKDTCVTQKVETVRGVVHFTFKDGTLACSVE